MGENVNFWWRNSNKICHYQSHPYILWKSSNVVWITLLSNIFLQYQFGETFPDFFQALKNGIFTLTIIVKTGQRYCRICQNRLMFLHGVIARSASLSENTKSSCVCIMIHVKFHWFPWSLSIVSELKLGYMKYMIIIDNEIIGGP